MRVKPLTIAAVVLAVLTAAAVAFAPIGTLSTDGIGLETCAEVAALSQPLALQTRLGTTPFEIPRRRGFGTPVIENIIGQLGGKVPRG